jgi:hypothetical protein
VGRLAQLFIAPGNEDDELPTAASAWHRGRYAKIPMEHWDVILDFAESLDPEKTQILRRYSYPAPDGKLLPPAGEHETIVAFIRHLQSEILSAPPLVPEANELFPENFPNEDHAQMLDAVVAVLKEAQRLGQPFEGDTN